MVTFRRVVPILAVLLVVPLFATAQINFPKSGYLVGVGDSVAAGEGALPVTHGFVYQLYDRGVFGRTQDLDFSTIAIKGAMASEVLAFQVPQVVCIRSPRIAVDPTVVVMTAGANDFGVRLLLWREANPGNPLPPVPVLDAWVEEIATTVANATFALLVTGVDLTPVGGQACPALGPDAKVLIGNYFGFPHPIPQIAQVIDYLLAGFDAALRDKLQGLIALGKVAVVDTFSAFQGKKGVLLIEKRYGYDETDPFGFEMHLTNAGHSLIAREFEKAWQALQ